MESIPNHFEHKHDVGQHEPTPSQPRVKTNPTKTQHTPNSHSTQPQHTYPQSKSHTPSHTTTRYTITLNTFTYKQTQTLQPPTYPNNNITSDILSHIDVHHIRHILTHSNLYITKHILSHKHLTTILPPWISHITHTNNTYISPQRHIMSIHNTLTTHIHLTYVVTTHIHTHSQSVTLESSSHLHQLISPLS